VLSIQLEDWRRRMTKRVIEISSGPLRISVKHHQLILTYPDDQQKQINTEDIGMLILDHPGVTFNVAVVNQLLDCGVSFLICGAGHLPVTWFFPVADHALQTERFRIQQGITLPLQKNLWKHIIQSKIWNQSLCLEACKKSPTDLRLLRKHVRSGDTSNLEGQAARIYWKELFGSNFRRDRDADSPNALLNYGYAILRSAIARKICSTGLHPTFGIHHRNRNNPFVLADDLIEPFRPLVGIVVYNLWESELDEINRSSKGKILGLMNQFVWIDEKNQSLQNAIEIYVNSYLESIREKKLLLKFPESLAYEIPESEE